jgi:hypothetical protein
VQSPEINPQNHKIKAKQREPDKERKRNNEKITRICLSNIETGNQQISESLALLTIEKFHRRILSGE